MKHLLEAKEGIETFTDSLQVSYVANSNILIATTQNECEAGDIEKSILLMKVDLAEI